MMGIFTTEDKSIMAQSGRGGRRHGAGRKKGPKTKVVRVEEALWEKIKSGYFDEIETLANDYTWQAEDASQTSPRWEKLREFAAAFKKIKEELSEP